MTAGGSALREQRLALVALLAAAAGLAVAVLLPVPVVAPVLTVLVAPALTAAGGLLALRRRGALSSGTAMRTAAFTAGALLCAFAALQPWAAGLAGADAAEQDASIGFSPELLLIGWLLGTAAIAPALAPLFSDVRRPLARALLAGWVGAVIALALGIALLLPGFALLAAAGTLFLLTWRREPVDPPRQPPGRPWPRRRSAALTAASLAGGSFALALATTGSWWPGFRGDGTAAMNAGLALGGLAMLPMLVAGGAALRARPRWRRSPAPVVAAAAVLTGSAAQTVGAGAPAQEGLLNLAAVLGGVAATAVLLPLLPRFGRWTPAVAVALSTGLAVAVGFPLVVAGPVLAPAAAAIALVVVRRRRGAGGTSAELGRAG